MGRKEVRVQQERDSTYRKINHLNGCSALKPTGQPTRATRPKLTLSLRPDSGGNATVIYLLQKNISEEGIDIAAPGSCKQGRCGEPCRPSVEGAELLVVEVGDPGKSYS